MIQKHKNENLREIKKETPIKRIKVKGNKIILLKNHEKH